MKPIFRTVSPKFFWLLSALIGLPGIYDLTMAIQSGNTLDRVRGLISCALAAYLAYCAVIAKQGGAARVNERPVVLTGYVLLALFSAGFVAKLARNAGWIVL